MEQSIVATAIVIMEVMNKKNGLLQCMETLKPISHWLMPEATKSLVNEIYKTYTKDKDTKCFICEKRFANNFLRDFHIINLHRIKVAYTCKQCEKNDYLDDDSIYFDDVYNYFIHLVEEHDEKVCHTPL